MKKTIIFDLDDTLVVEVASADAAFQATCEVAAKETGVDPKRLHTSIREACRSFWKNSPARPYCLNVGISSWEGLWAEFIGEDDNLGILAEWAPTYRQNSWQKALAFCGVDDSRTLAKELSEVFISERRKRHVVYDEVVSVLEQLKKRYRLGLLTNGSPDLQRRKLEGSGLESYFYTVVISGEVGYGKPDTRIYGLVLDRLGTEPDSAVMVGNSLNSDIAPAMELGMKAVWVNRENILNTKHIAPHLEIANLTQLDKIFEQAR